VARIDFSLSRSSAVLFVPSQQSGKVRAMVSVVQQLEEAFEAKKKEISDLTAKKEPIEKEIQEIDRQIQEILGDGRTLDSVLGLGKRGSRRKRVRNDKPLREYVLEALKRSKGGLPLGQLSVSVRESGYKTHSGNFSNVVYQFLYNNSDKVKYDSGSGKYSLIK
jgi:hypothetical protein